MNLIKFALKIVRACYRDIDSILIDIKSHENILIYDISHIRFGKIDQFMRIYDQTRYLTLSDSKKYDAIYS